MSWFKNLFSENNPPQKKTVYEESGFSFEYPEYMSRINEGGITLAFYRADNIRGVLRFTRILPGENYNAEKLILSTREQEESRNIKVKNISLGNHKCIYWKETKTFLEADNYFWNEELMRERRSRIPQDGLQHYVQLSTFLDMQMHYWCFGVNDIFMYWSYRTFLADEKLKEVREEMRDVEEILKSVK
jgi:hypothetical protein